MKDIYDVVIVGAGPAGLFCADRLVRNGFKDVLIVDMGWPIGSRWCPETQACDCRSCYVLEGGGGAGGFSDGKLPYSLGRGTQMMDLFDPSLEPFLWEIDAKVVQHAGKGVWYDKGNDEDFHDLDDTPLEFSSYPLRHVGSDGIRRWSQGMIAELMAEGVEFLYHHKMVERKTPDWYDGDQETIVLRSLQGRGEVTVAGGDLILAPGIQGLPWIAELMESLDLDMIDGPAGIGLRIETPLADMRCIFDRFYDWKVVYEAGPGVVLRSFCCNSHGAVVNQFQREMGVRGVNGHASLAAEERTRSANFALVARLDTKRVASPSQLVQKIARDINALTGGHTAVQRLSDFMHGRWSLDTGLIPWRTNHMAREGVDISAALPPDIYRAFRDFLSYLEYGLGSPAPDQALVYAPELKYPARRAPVNLKNYRLEGYPNIHLIGDATGYVDSLVAAALTGIVAAEDISGG